MNKLFRCEPEAFPPEDGGLPLQSGFKVQLMQGGLVQGKPTIFLSVDGVECRVFVSDLRQSLDILEPVKPKRERKKKVKAMGQTLLGKVVTP